MRILQLIGQLNYGGAAALVTQWAKQLDISEHKIEVCATYSMGYYAEQLENAGITVHSIGLETEGVNLHPQRKYNLRIVPSLIHLLRKEEYDIVHAHLFPTSMYCAVASYFAQGKYFFSEHSIYNRRRDYPILKAVDWGVYRQFDRIIAVSKPVREALLTWLPSLEHKTRLVNNCIDPDIPTATPSQLDGIRKELGITKDDVVILYAGRLLHAKGPDVLLEALIQQTNDSINTKVLIAGDGELRESLTKFITENSLNDRVSILGFRSDVPILISLTDLIVLPSRWEGLPMILLEAMAAGKPVVATAVGGVPDVIQDGINGWLVPPENPEMLSKSITTVLSDRDLQIKIGAHARQTIVEHFSVRSSVEKLLSIYNEVL
jgi:glycosyltransferase involved in cell wall biosynthesis